MKLINKFIPLLLFFLLSSCASFVDANKPNPLYDDICNNFKFLYFCDDIPYVEIIEIYNKETIDSEDIECDLTNKEEQIEKKNNENIELSYQDKQFIYSSFKESCLQEIIEYKDKSYLKKYMFCCSFFNTTFSGQKSFAYFDVHKNNVIIGLGTGEFSYLTYSELEKDLLNVYHIPSNFNEVVVNEEIYEPGWFSVKDILIHGDTLLVSYTKEKDDNCYNTSIIKADFNYEYLSFSEFFSPEECINTNNKPSFSGHSSGGKLSITLNNNYLLTTGEFLSREKAQDKTSNLGKTLLIDINGKKINNASIGHRNPQGLVYSGVKTNYLLTEHGPLGGDEINVIDISKENVNYGWPLSSYGDHYGNIKIEGAPLYKSHSIYGFEEPVYFFNPSIGISSIDRSKDKNTFFVASLNNRKLYKIGFNDDLTKPIFIQQYPVRERIRDIFFIKELGLHILSLEDTPYIAILKEN